MQKTTVYLPRDDKAALTRLARQRHCSEADIVREALARIVHQAEEAPEPRLPLFRARGRPLGRRVDEALGEGFGLP